MKKIIFKNPSIIKAILEKSLSIWIKSKCSEISNLKLKLKGDTTQILLGNINSVEIQAHDIEFNDIRIKYTELSTGEINLQLNLATLNIDLKNSCTLHGSIVLTNDDIEQTLASDKWKQLRESLTRSLIGESKVSAIFFKGDNLIIRTNSKKNLEGEIFLFKMKNNSNDLLIYSEISKSKFTLPIDTNIAISDLKIQNGELIFTFNSKLKES